MRSDFAIRLYNARRISGLSLDGLSEAMNHAVSKQCLSRYEMGVMKPRPKILLAISEALGITAGYFSGVSSNINYPMLRASVQCEMTDELLCQIESIILFHVESIIAKTKCAWGRKRDAVIELKRDALKIRHISFAFE